MNTSFPADLAPPNWMATLLEPLGLLEIPRLLLRFPELKNLPKGNGEPIMVIPGFMTNDASTLLLRHYLKTMGYTVYRWRQGINVGDVDHFIPELLKDLDRHANQHKMPLTLLGWSLGGYLSRELAHFKPELVKHVITMGTPVSGGPKYTSVSGVFELMGMDVDIMEQELIKEQKEPLNMPISIIYSKLDGIVSWGASLDKVNDTARFYEVSATHVGLGFCPEVYALLAKIIAEQYQD